MGLCERDKFGLGLEGTKSGRWRVVWSVAKTSELGPLILKTLALTFRLPRVSAVLNAFWEVKSSYWALVETNASL